MVAPTRSVADKSLRASTYSGAHVTVEVAVERGRTKTERYQGEREEDRACCTGPIIVHRRRPCPAKNRRKEGKREGKERVESRLRCENFPKGLSSLVSPLADVSAEGLRFKIFKELDAGSKVEDADVGVTRDASTGRNANYARSEVEAKLQRKVRTDAT